MIGKSICQISMYQIISIKQKKVLRRTLMESKLQVITYVVDDNYTTYDIPFVPNREFTITSSDGFEENVTSNDSDVQIDKNKK